MEFAISSNSSCIWIAWNGNGFCLHWSDVWKFEIIKNNQRSVLCSSQKHVNIFGNRNHESQKCQKLFWSVKTMTKHSEDKSQNNFVLSVKRFHSFVDNLNVALLVVGQQWKYCTYVTWNVQYTSWLYIGYWTWQLLSISCHWSRRSKHVYLMFRLF